MENLPDKKERPLSTNIFSNFDALLSRVMVLMNSIYLYIKIYAALAILRGRSRNG